MNPFDGFDRENFLLGSGPAKTGKKKNTQNTSCYISRRAY